MEQRDVPTMLAAIRVTGDGRQNLVQSNMVTKGTHDAIDCDSSHGNTEANTIWD